MSSNPTSEPNQLDRKLQIHAVRKHEEGDHPRFEVDDEFLDDLKELIQLKSSGSIVNILSDLYSPDIAYIMSNLDPDERLYLFELLDNETASEVLLELDEKIREELLEHLSHLRIRNIVGELDSDDAADIVGELSDEVAERVLDNIAKEDSQTLKELLRYPTDSAGGIMATEFVSVKKDDTVQKAIQRVRKMAKEIGEIYNVYVLDDDGVLIGYIPVKDLIIHSPRRRVKNVMTTEFHTVDVLTDQEEVARLMKKYDLVTVPVVNSKGQMLGKITFDDIMDVIHEETEEDIQKLGAVVALDISYNSAGLGTLFRKRIGWLLALVVANLMSSTIIATFEETLQAMIALAFFLPLLIDSGGNVGSQAATLMVRALATGDLTLRKWLTTFSKELGVGASLGIVMGVSSALLGIIRGGIEIGIIVGLSMMLIVLFANLIGSMLPFVLTRFRLDPAVASSPLITTLADSVGLLIYFTIATTLLRFIPA